MARLPSSTVLCDSTEFRGISPMRDAIFGTCYGRCCTGILGFWLLEPNSFSAEVVLQIPLGELTYRPRRLGSLRPCPFHSVFIDWRRQRQTTRPACAPDKLPTPTLCRVKHRYDAASSRIPKKNWPGSLYYKSPDSRSVRCFRWCSMSQWQK